MNIIDIITKKKNKESLTYEEIKYTVDNFVNGNIKDYQMSSLLMAITINSMSLKETYYLTKAMIESSDILDLSSIDGIIVDKHSTGGVGDKTTLVVAPLVASLNVKVAKMSGRGLGITGGTIDKLESIEGFKTKLSNKKFIDQVNKINISLISQTKDIAKADKKIYALRDVTATTESIPLIASSIMSKKIASGSNKIVIDLKVGKGAFIKNIKDAKKLAKTMIYIGKKFKKKVVVLITDMTYPLGNTIGNALEVKEAIDVLNGNGDEKFTKLCITLASYMVHLGKNISIEKATDLVVENLNNKNGLNKFYELIKYQGGNIDKIEISKNKYKVLANTNGYLTDIDTVKLAKYSIDLGSGRKEKDDVINHKVGIIINKKINDKIEAGDILCYIVSDKKVNPNDLIDAFTIKDKPIKEKNINIDILK